MRPRSARRRAPALVALASLVALAVGAASCGQLLGLRDDLDLADAGPAVDVESPDASDGAANADAPLHDDGARDDADVESDAAPVVPPCTLGATGICVVKTITVAPVAFAAASLSVYYGAGTSLAGITRLTSEGLPSSFGAGSGTQVKSIVALDSHVAFGGVGPTANEQVVVVSGPDGAGALQTKQIAPPPSAVALTSTHVAWLQDSSVLSVAISNLQGTENSVAATMASAVVGAASTFAVTFPGTPITVRTTGTDGTSKDLYTFPSTASIVLTAIDPSGGLFAAASDRATTTVDSLAGGQVTSLPPSISGVPKGICASAADVFVAIELPPNGSGAIERAILRVDRAAPQTAEVLRRTPGAVGLVAHDGTYAYWVEIAGANAATIYRWAKP